MRPAAREAHARMLQHARHALEAAEAAEAAQAALGPAAPGRAGAKKRGAPTENLSSAELLWLQSLEQPPVAAA